MSFEDFLKSIGFFWRISKNYWSHPSGYSLVIEGDKITVKDTLEFDILYSGDREGTRGWLSEVFDV